MIPTDTSWPFEFKRIQFPLQICYAMTINKSQGQSLDTVGLYLPRAVFSHGHVYVAMWKFYILKYMFIFQYSNQHKVSVWGDLVVLANNIYTKELQSPVIAIITSTKVTTFMSKFSLTTQYK